MSHFKNQLEYDIHEVFLNLDEFAEYGEFAGHEMVPMVVEALALDMPPSSSDDRVAVSYEGVAVHVAAADVPDELLTMRKTTFRHEQWFVLSSGCEGGLKTVQLYRERA